MKDILLVGGGKIGAMITDLLANSGDFRVTVADFAGKPAGEARRAIDPPARCDGAALAAHSPAGSRCSRLPLRHPRRREGGGRRPGSLFDLTEDVKTTRHVAELAKTARSVMMPQCGLAPGFVSIAAHDLASRFEELDEVRMRVGALTENPTNRLEYELTWSVEGLVHEYIAECDAIVDGKACKVQPLEGLESLTLNGIEYEAFNTSGG